MIQHMTNTITLLQILKHFFIHFLIYLYQLTRVKLHKCAMVMLVTSKLHHNTIQVENEHSEKNFIRYNFR